MRTHTREKALTEREFERLLIGAMQIDNSEVSLETRAILLIGGRLGLRGGEIAHLSESWVDRRRQMISIPTHDPCTKGNGGAVCGYCKQAARQQVKHDSDKELDDVLDSYWNPKTENSARDVPFGWSQRVGVAIDWLVETYGSYPNSFSTIQRRVNQAIEHTECLDKNDTSLHGLRATAASYHAGRGLDAGPLQSMFGWADLTTAKAYIAVDGEMTARALGEVHG